MFIFSLDHPVHETLRVHICVVACREITNTHDVTFAYLHNGYASMCRVLKCLAEFFAKSKESR